jgi:dolichol-phosphate mannosyltransferase
MIEGLRVAVVMPAYRVARELPGVLSRMPHGVDRIFVVDDASPDDLASALSGVDDERVQLLVHATNQGVGGATVTGMLAAIEDGADVIVKCDADGQMDPADIPGLVQPIASGSADHVKGSRYHHAKELGAMPRMRLLGNIGLTFLTKLCSGYWNVLDPVNGFFATRADVLGRIQLSKLARRYFFESDLLIRLNIIEARVADMPQPARYGGEQSSLSLTRALFEFPWHLLGGLGRRIFWRYLFYDVSPVAAFGIVGLMLATFGVLFGSWQWVAHASQGIATPLGTIMLAAAPLTLGFQLLLQAVILDIANTPRASVPTSALIPSSRPPARRPSPLPESPARSLSPLPASFARAREDAARMLDPPGPSPAPRLGPAERALLDGEPTPARARAPEGAASSAAATALTADGQASLPALPFTTAQALSALSALGASVAIVALVDLAIRAAVRLELRWDTFLYHVPFAAFRGGLNIPYQQEEWLQALYRGFPPLPHLVQGLLWRLTGSMNATGVINALALGGLLLYGQRTLRAPFWLVALIALTAPLVVIHSAVSYVDLFGNAFLAAGACSCLYVFLFPSRARRGMLVGGLLALVGAAWSKYQLVAVVALLLPIFTLIALRLPRSVGLTRRNVALLCAGMTLLAAAPYLENLISHGNPFWPIRLPLVGDLFPYTKDAISEGANQRPPTLMHLSQFSLFFHSLFEIDHPTSYPNRARWIIDQGNAWLAFRMGGYWGVAAAVYLCTASAMLVACCRKRGLVAALGMLAVLGFVAFLPQSHELRYYLFIPLAGAVTIGMLFPELRRIAPRTALGLVSLTLGLFLYMVSENWVHYRIERIDQREAARTWGADVLWAKLDRGKVNCAVDMAPLSVLLTGPTLSEFAIVDRPSANLCPKDSVIIRR